MPNGNCQILREKRNTEKARIVYARNSREAFVEGNFQKVQNVIACEMMKQMRVSIFSFFS